jgi:hypothetical protein
MKASPGKKLTIRDFAFVNDPGVGGLTYQNGPYLILVGRESYSCAYKGLTFSWGHESITEAVEACDKRARRLEGVTK